MLKLKNKALIAIAVFGLIFIPVISSFAETLIYNYDDLNRLKWMQYGDGTMIEYSYDEAGNRVEKDVISPTQDTDGDGMTDVFEIYYGLNRKNPSDAGIDSDGDTLTNLQEYQLGTNPLNPDTDGDGRGDASDTCPLSPPVCIAGACYRTLQEAYNAAFEGDIIQSQAVTLIENPDFYLTKSVTIQGGYDCDYSTQTGKTIINGNMTVSNGTVIIGDFILQ